MATLLGAFVAAAVALWLVDGFAVTFSIGTFALEITPKVLATGVLGGLALAVVGALPPAWTCLKPELPAALRAS